MRWVRLALAALVSASGLVLLGAPAALGCDCASVGVAQHFQRADAVLRATVVGIQEPRRRRVVSSLAPRTYVLDVDRVFEGASRDEVRSALLGASCGLVGIEVGRRYVFFAREERGRLWADLCGGTGPASPRLVRVVERVSGWAGDVDAAAVRPGVDDFARWVRCWWSVCPGSA